MMTINVLRCPRNAGAVANNKRVHASSDRCSSSNSTKNTNTNSRRRKGVVLSSFGKAWKSLFISLFFFFLVLSLRSRERKKRLNSLLSCVLLLLLLLREEDLVLFRARAQTTSTSTALRYRHRPRSRIDLRGVLRARKERDLLSQERERENKTTAEGRGEKVFLLSFLSFSFCFLQNQSKKTGVEEDPSCGSESVAVKKGGRKGKEERIFFFVLTFILSLFSRTYKNRE